MVWEFQNFSPQHCNGYELTFEASVGGFLYVGFLPSNPHHMICVSSDYISLIDCETGHIQKEIDGDYDEEELVAYIEVTEETIPIAGQYGGKLPLTHGSFHISSQRDESGPYPLVKLFWTSPYQRKKQIYSGYLPYIYGFSPDKRFFVFAHDGGLCILKSTHL